MGSSLAADTYKYFRIEARELLDDMSRAALALESAPSSDLVQRLLRHAHTLKGAARIVKQVQIADACHALEELLGPHRAGGALSRGLTDALLKLVDTMNAGLAAIDAPAASPKANVAVESTRDVRHATGELDALLDSLSEAHARLSTLRKTSDGLARATRLADLVSQQLASRSQHQPEKARAMSEELRAILTALERGVSGTVDQIDRELWQSRDVAEQLRLVPADSVFTLLERTARDAAQVLGKRVSFHATGGEVRLDAHVLSTVQPALVQLIRNAVAHGIAAAGNVLVSVRRQGRHVVFTVEDDGVGIDIEAVRRSAEARGQVAPSTSAQVLNVLLSGGFSTAQHVTEVAGRGVGLDVIRVAVEKLGGSASLQTERGRGTAFELTFPLSVVALPSLLLECDGRVTSLPLDAVRRTVRISANALVYEADRASVSFEGQLVPFVSLAQVLRSGQRRTSEVRTWSIVVVGAKQGLAALGVDRLLGTSTTVLRPLPSLVEADAVIAGASLDAEGNAQLMLDPEGLVAWAADARLRPSRESTPLPVLVVDDSMTTRMLELSILESAGFVAETANSAEEALEKLRARAFGLILVDVEMPGMDGFELVTRVRSDPALRHVPAILLTSRDAAEDKARGESVGAQGYIVKSEFDQEHLLAQMRRLL